MTPRDRSHLLWRIGDLIDEHAEEFAQLESLDNGKSLASARGDVGVAAELFRYFAGWATKMEGTHHPDVGAGPRVPRLHPPRADRRRRRHRAVELPADDGRLQDRPGHHRRQHGRPQAGRADPADRAAASASCCLEAGVPAGVVNVVTGFGDDRAPRWSTHPGVDKVAFTGSTEVGKKIAAGGLGQPQEGLARARRQGAQHHLRRRRPRRRDRRRRAGAATSTRASAASTARGSTSSATVFDQVDRGRRRGGPRDQGRRRASTRPRTWARWSRRSSTRRCCGYVRGAVADGATLTAGSADRGRRQRLLRLSRR